MTGSGYIVRLDGGDCDIATVGGKALNLSRMAGYGFGVPPAAAVSVAAYERFLDETGLRSEIAGMLAGVNYEDLDSVKEASERIGEAIVSREMPGGLTSEIEGCVESLGGEHFAVRSSAVAEDLEDASFAGEQDTYLNVPADDVPVMVRRCWASYWTDRAMLYRQQRGIDHLAQGIAVVLQRMVASEVSGIMFTADPVTGAPDIVIEASWGLGESIASGIVTPDRYVCGRDGTPKEVTVKTKEKAYRLADGRNTLVDVPPELRDVRCADDDVLAAVCAQGAALEERFGRPQDVEWAMEGGKVYVLQSRAITTLADPSEKDGRLWTRAYGDEYWADPTTPLFYTTMGKMLVEYVNHEGARNMGYRDLYDAPLIKLHKTRVYFYTKTLETVFGHYPKFIRSKELLNYFPVSMQEGILDGPEHWGATIKGVIKPMIVDRDGMMGRTDDAYKKWAAGFMGFCRDRIDSVDLEALSDADLEKLYWDLEEASKKHYRLIRYGMVSHSIATNLMVKAWLAKWIGDDGSLYAELVSGLPNNKTVETNIGFSDLGKVIRDNPDISRRIEEMGPDAFLEWMDNNENPLKPEFDAFLREYGHRANTREIMVPRWCEDRAHVLDIAYQNSKSYVDLREVERKRAEERERCQKDVVARIRKTRMGWIRSKLFEYVRKKAQTYLVFRENQRFYLDHILLRQRRIFLEMARRFVADGRLKRTDDIFFLEESEALGMLRDGTPVPDPAALRRRMADFDRYKDTLPPKFLRDGVDFDDPEDAGESVGTITGAASSPGTVTGTVRVVLDISRLSEVQKGEILVTSNTDPGWTAAFARLGGLVTETGGILCHGAVISREYRIPAVTAVKDATKRLRTGQRVTLDGGTGTIYILEDDEDGRESRMERQLVLQLPRPGGGPDRLHEDRQQAEQGREDDVPLLRQGRQRPRHEEVRELRQREGARVRGPDLRDEGRGVPPRLPRAGGERRRPVRRARRGHGRGLGAGQPRVRLPRVRGRQGGGAVLQGRLGALRAVREGQGLPVDRRRPRGRRRMGRARQERGRPRVGVPEDVVLAQLRLRRKGRVQRHKALHGHGRRGRRLLRHREGQRPGREVGDRDGVRRQGARIIHDQGDRKVRQDLRGLRQGAQARRAPHGGRRDDARRDRRRDDIRREDRPRRGRVPRPQRMNEDGGPPASVLLYIL